MSAAAASNRDSMDDDDADGGGGDWPENGREAGVSANEGRVNRMTFKAKFCSAFTSPMAVERLNTIHRPCQIQTTKHSKQTRNSV